MVNQDETGADSAVAAPESVLGFLLNQAAGVVRERTAAALAPLGITPRSLGVLLALHERPGVSQTELRARLRIDRTTTSQLIDDLTKRRLIKRAVAPGDRRNHQLNLTAGGVRTLRLGSEVAHRVESEFTSGLSDDHLAAFKATLAQLLESACPPPASAADAAFDP